MKLMKNKKNDAHTVMKKLSETQEALVTILGALQKV